jgi:serine/threonine protein kinase
MTQPSHFGRYRVKKVLGQGAMGLVYLADDPVISRQVAIKVIKAPSGENTEELLARFDREFRSAGTLSHPNVVTVYDVGKQDDTHFIALEYVHGHSLEETLASTRILPWEQVVDCITQICSALDYAHERGIVHRDIKPANILINATGHPKITDFGVAKFTSGTSVTQERTTVGTPTCMSPEQAQGHPVTGASDQFAVGVILYRMVTGERPFTGETPTTVLYRIVHELPIPVNTLNPRIPPALNDVIMKALAKDPRQRHPSCTALAQALNDVVAHARSSATVVAGPASLATIPSETTATPTVATVSATAVWPWRMIAGIGSALVLLATGLWLLRASETDPNLPQQSQMVEPESIETAIVPVEAIARRVRVESNPVGASIWLDGTDLATLTPAEVEIEGSSGQVVRLELRRAGTITAETTFTLGQQIPETWAPEETSTSGSIDVLPIRYQIATRPRGAQVVLNGESLESVTPVFVELIPETSYTIRTELDGYDPAGWAFTLNDLNDTQRTSQRLDFPLTASYVPGYLVLNAPYSVTIDVRASGTDNAQPHRYGPSANLEIPVRPGAYDLTLSAPSVYFKRTLTVDIATSARREIQVPELISVQVAAVPSNCRVRIDGGAVEVLPFQVNITRGRHEFEFEWPTLGQSVTRVELISEPQQRVFATAGKT